MDEKQIKKLIETKQQEIKKLQEEIETLKSSLITSNSNIKQELTREEKIEIFMNYFKGRDDVYPYLPIDKNNPNIKYYIPTCHLNTHKIRFSVSFLENKSSMKQNKIKNKSNKNQNIIKWKLNNSQ